MAEQIVVVGAGGFAREALDVIEAVNNSRDSPRWTVAGFFDDAPSETNLMRMEARGYRHLGTLSDAKPSHQTSRYIVGIGSPAVRMRIAARLDSLGWEAATLIHPSAQRGSNALVGAGSVVCGGVQVSTNSRLGVHVHVNPGAIVGHDAVLDDFVSVNPGAVVSGDVHVATRVLVGAGAVILQGLEVGADVVVGAAACVTRPIPAGSVVVGVPARPLTSGGGRG